MSRITKIRNMLVVLKKKWQKRLSFYVSIPVHTVKKPTTSYESHAPQLVHLRLGSEVPTAGLKGSSMELTRFRPLECLWNHDRGEVLDCIWRKLKVSQCSSEHLEFGGSVVLIEGKLQTFKGSMNEDGIKERDTSTCCDFDLHRPVDFRGVVNHQAA